MVRRAQRKRRTERAGGRQADCVIPQECLVVVYDDERFAARVGISKKDALAILGQSEVSENLQLELFKLTLKPQTKV